MRPQYWFPLVLLGMLTLGGAALRFWDQPVYGSQTYRSYSMQFLSQEQLGTGGITGTGFGPGKLFPPVGFGSSQYWLVGVLLVLLATAAWYAVRARRWQMFVVAAISGTAAVLMTYFATGERELALSVGGALVVIGGVVIVWRRFQVSTVSVVALALGVPLLLVGVVPAGGALWVVVGGLLVLAWYERSVIALVVAVTFLVVAWIFLPGLTATILMGCVLFLGAVAALLVQRPGGVISPS
jgi:hypothetical protein